MVVWVFFEEFFLLFPSSACAPFATFRLGADAPRGKAVELIMTFSLSSLSRGMFKGTDKSRER